MFSEHIMCMGVQNDSLIYLFGALAIRCALVSFVALLMRSALAKRCVFTDLCTWSIYNILCIHHKLASSFHSSIQFIDAQRRNAFSFVTEGVDCASCMCDWGAMQPYTQICHILYSDNYTTLYPDMPYFIFRYFIS